MRPAAERLHLAELKELFRDQFLLVKLDEEFLPLQNVRPLWDMKHKYFLRALLSCDYNLSLTARKLEISLRTCRLWLNNLRDHGFNIPVLCEIDMERRRLRKAARDQ